MYSYREDSYEIIIDKIKNNPFIVYGAGGHATKFVQAVEEMGYRHNILGFAVTENVGNNKKIQVIEAVDRDTFIVIAAHDKNARQMERTLKKLGFQKYISIYPYLIEICYGEAYQIGETIDVDSFLEECKYGNYLAVHYLAIDYIMGNNNIGKDLYMHVLGNCSNEQTTKQRWESFSTRVDNYKRGIGFEAYHIKINPQDKFILDGYHRICLAKYFGIRKIKADYFNTDIQKYNSMTFRSMWTDDEIKTWFSESISKEIINVRKWILGQG